MFEKIRIIGFPDFVKEKLSVGLFVRTQASNMLLRFISVPGDCLSLRSLFRKGDPVSWQ